MSARSSEYLRLAVACLLIASCGGFCVASLRTQDAERQFGSAFFVMAMLSVLFCICCVAKRPINKRSLFARGAVYVCLVLVCIGIPLTILLVVPTCRLVNEAPARGEVRENLLRIGFAMYAYHDCEHHLPPSAIYSKDGNPLLSWRVALLPHLGHEHLYRQFKLDEPWDSPSNLALADQMPDVYGLPPYLDDRADLNTTYFQVYVGPGTAFEGKAGISIRDFPDGTSNTVLVVIAPEPVLWTKPVDLEFLPAGPVVHPNTRIFQSSPMLFADTSVQYTGGAKLTDDQWRAMIMRNSGKSRER